jgi:hypothetical protein
LWATDAARKLHLEHPQCGFATQQIADTLALEAVRAGVPICLPWGDSADEANRGEDLSRGDRLKGRLRQSRSTVGFHEDGA